MNASLQNKLFEAVSSNHVAYILNDNNDFSVTGFKVMDNQSNSFLLPCSKIMYNGQIKLVYIIGNYKPLSFIVTRLGVNELNAVILNLIQRVMEIQANGFFKAESLELDFDKIFVDTGDYSVHLIYFPVSPGNTGKISSFESEFRVALINLFNSYPVFNAPQFQRLCVDLSNGSMPLNQALKRLHDNFNGRGYSSSNRGSFGNGYGEAGNIGGAAESGKSRKSGNGNIGNENGMGGNSYGGGQKENNYGGENARKNGGYGDVRQGNSGYLGGKGRQGYDDSSSYNAADYYSGGNSGQAAYGNNGYNSRNEARQPEMTVTAINSPVQMTFSVTSPEFKIGKNPAMVDGVINYNPAISRVHCAITYNSGKYYITDLGSANGTYVNQTRLEKQQSTELHSGDYIKLANSDFIVSF